MLPSMKRRHRTIESLIVSFLVFIVGVLLTQSNAGSTQTIQSEHSKEARSLGLVTHVVDGDTFDILLNGETKRVRLIGVDTPETVDPRKEVQCFGKEASNKTKSMINDKQVYLEADASQTDEDKYGRLLRYVYLEDGVLLNELLVREGFAHEYTYKVPYQFQTTFRTAQKEAQAQRRGLWDPSLCP